MTESAVSAPQSKPSFSLWQRVAGWVVNPWGKPRFLGADHVGATCCGRSSR